MNTVIKKSVTVGGFVTEGDRQGIERQLKNGLKPIFGEIEINWQGQTADRRPAFVATDIEPDQMAPLRDALKNVFGSHCAMTLHERRRPGTPA